MSKTNITIITYNIHKGFSPGNRRFVLHDIKQSLHHIDADIIFLQEIHGQQLKAEKTISDWPGQTQFEFIADEIWHHYAYGKNAIYRSGHHGNAILSKYPFIKWDNIDISLMRTASRSLLHGTIEFPETSQHLHIICVHLGLFGLERRKQLSTLIKRINSHVPLDAPLIIAGDFNDWSGKASQFFNKTLGVHEVFKTITGSYAKTFPAWRPILTMDRIYCRGLDIVECKHLKGSPWRKLSDHTPLLAEFSYIPQDAADINRTSKIA